MEMINLSVPATNKFATGYLDGAPEIQQFFHYRYGVSEDYEARLMELNNRTFMRKELIECIGNYMSPFPSSHKVEKSLTKLAKENSVVVIGGQQAGILTGPLYSIHKIISIISLARQKEAELKVPVVPVFWIAGEDHDFQEVNHIYIEKEEKVQKISYPEKVLKKKMVSDINLNQDLCLEWVEEIVAVFGETDHTHELLHFLRKSINHCATFVDFFAYIVMELFKDYGLLIIDSGDAGLRRLEKEIFIKQIEQAAQTTTCVKKVQKQLSHKGYNTMIEISDRAANIFYYDDHHKERILLEYDQIKEQFIGQNGAVRFSKSQLLQLANEFPQKISNNVVTRPITQELLFPTLAFIAGPGEIAYWAELKTAFESFSVKMPPIVPRLNITLLDRSVETDIKELGLSLAEVLTYGTERKQLDYLSSVKDQELMKVLQTTKAQICENYQLIENKVDKGLVPLLKKNESILLKQIEFMEEKIEASLREKHENILNKFRRVDNKLRPLGSPQERILNALYYMNRYGIPFFAELAGLTYTFDGNHKVVKI